MAAEPKAAGRACILQTSVKLSHFDLIHGFRGSRVRWHHPGRGVICDSGYAAASPPRHCPGRIGTDAALWKMIGGIRISRTLYLPNLLNLTYRMNHYIKISQTQNCPPEPPGAV